MLIIFASVHRKTFLFYIPYLYANINESFHEIIQGLAQGHSFLINENENSFDSYEIEMNDPNFEIPLIEIPDSSFHFPELRDEFLWHMWLCSIFLC
jgi:hypothetical protein